MKQALRDIKSAFENDRTFSDLYNVTRENARVWLHNHPEPAAGRRIYNRNMRKARQLLVAKADPITAYLDIYGLESMDSNGRQPHELINWFKS